MTTRLTEKFQIWQCQYVGIDVGQGALSSSIPLMGTLVRQSGIIQSNGREAYSISRQVHSHVCALEKLRLMCTRIHGEKMFIKAMLTIVKRTVTEKTTTMKMSWLAPHETMWMTLRNIVLDTEARHKVDRADHSLYIKFKNRSTTLQKLGIWCRW